MVATRPKLEQVEFRSARTGSHSLDSYLESAEYGNRTLPDLLGDIFASNGEMRDDLFEFRVDPTTYALQTRRGLYLNASQGWVDVPTGFFFRPRGNWSANTAYDVHDLFLYQQSLFMVTVAHTSASSGPSSSETMVLISGIAGRIPVEDADLANNGGKFLQVRPTEDGYSLVNSTAKPAFFGFNVVGNELILTYGADADYTPSDYETWGVFDIGYTFAVQNNNLVHVL